MTRHRRWPQWMAWCGCALGGLTLGACAARSIGIGHDTLVALKDAPPVKVARYTPPAFTIEDPGNSVVGSLGGVSGGVLVMPGRSAGSTPLESEYAINDPGLEVRARVLEALGFELGVRAADREGPPLSDDRLDAIRQALGQEGWLLDVKTLAWGLAYDPKIRTRYRVQVRARTRLIDLEQGRVVWQATCDGSERDAPNGSLLTELTAHDATALKARLVAAADRCADDLVEHFFSGVR